MECQGQKRSRRFIFSAHGKGVGFSSRCPRALLKHQAVIILVFVISIKFKDAECNIPCGDAAASSNHSFGNSVSLGVTVLRTLNQAETLKLKHSKLDSHMSLFFNIGSFFNDNEHFSKVRFVECGLI